MSKKTAKSKGYRSYKKEKPFLTKKEIYTLIAIVALILIAVIAFACYDDGALKIKDGVAVDAQDNWLIINNGSSSSARYFKVAEVGEIEGFTRESTPSLGSSVIKDIRFYPEDEASPVSYISVGTSLSNSADLSELVIRSLEGTDGYEITVPLANGELNGLTYSSYGYSTNTFIATTQEEADAAAAGETFEPNTFGQSMNAYVNGPEEGCIVVHVIRETESAEEFIPDEDLIPYMESAIAAITIEK